MAEEFVFVGDLDIRKILAKLKRLEAGMKQFETTGTEATKKIQTTGAQRFRQLGFALQRFGIGGAAAFGEIFAAAGAAGIAIGGVLVAVKLVTKAFMVLFNVAKRTMKQIIELGVEAAKEYEIAEAQFTAVFKGGNREAQATLKVVKELSRSLGQNVTGIARAFFPEVENLDQLERVVNIGVALARAQPEQGAFGARISLLDALSGEFRSLQRRFEFTPTAISKIRDAFETAGIGGLLQEIQAELERTGRSIEDLSDTFEVRLNQIQETGRQTAGILGEPIVEELKEQLEGFLEFFEDNRDDIDRTAKGIGTIIADLVENVGTELQSIVADIDFDDVLITFSELAGVGERLLRVVTDLLGSFDTEGVATFATSVGGAVRNLEIFLVMLGDTKAVMGGFVDVLKTIIGLIFGADKAFGEMTDSGEDTKSLLEGLAGFWARLNGIIQSFIAMIESVAIVFKILNGELGLAEAHMAIQAHVTGAYEKELRQLNDALTETTQLTLDQVEAIDDLTEADEAAASARTARINAERRLGELREKIQESEGVIAEKTAEFDMEAAARFAKIELDQQRKRLDMMIENARRRIDIDEKAWDKLEDLQTDYNDRAAALAVDLGRDLEDAEIEDGRKRLKIEMDLNQERRDLEKEHLRRLEEIRRKFDFQAQEAIRANDAIAFLRIRRRMEFELNEERMRRDDSIDDAEQSAEDKRQTLDNKLQEEIEDANRANRRKIDDLNTWLGQQTAAITRWTDREFEKQDLRFARDKADNVEHQKRLMEDYDTWWRERHARLDAGIAEEVAKLEGFRDTVRSILASFPHLASISGLSPGGVVLPPGAGRGSRGIGGSPQGPGSVSDRRAELIQLWIRAGRDRSDLAKILPTLGAEGIDALLRELQSELGLAEGGSVKGKGVHLVGEPLPGNKPNPELFVAPTDGFIVPLSRMARASGRTPSEIMSIIKRMSSSDLINFSDTMRAHLGIDGRQFGGPVRRGESVQVGETSPGGPPNPEIFLPMGLGESLGGVLGRQPGVLSSMASKAAANTPFVNMLPGQRLTASAGGLGPFGAGDQAGGLGRMFMTGPGIGNISIDNSKSVTVNDPQLNAGLTDKEIGQVKELILRMRLEEELL